MARRARSSPSLGYIIDHTHADLTSVRHCSGLSWSDCEKTVSILDAWTRTPMGKKELFSGDFLGFFPLHDKRQQKWLKDNWGSFRLVLAPPGLCASLLGHSNTAC